MKRNFYFKTGLATLLALLFVGVGQVKAQAQWSEIVNCNFENSETLFNNDSRITVSNSKDDAEGSNVLNFVTAKNSANGYTLATYDFSSLVSATAEKLKVEFDYNLSKTNSAYNRYITLGNKAQRGGFAKSSYSASGAIFNFGLWRSSGVNYFAINGVKENSMDNVLGAWAHASITLDYATNTISYTISSLDKATTYYEAENVDFLTKDLDCNEIDFFDCANNVTSSIDNLVISQYVDNSKKSADYKINFTDGTNVIKTETETGFVGEVASLSATDKSSFFTDGIKYSYVSDDAADKTIAEDGSTVVTVTVKEADKYNYTVVSSLGTTIATGSYYGDEKVTVAYPKYELKDGTLYEAPKTDDNKKQYNATFTLSSDNQQYTINYKATNITNVVFYTEAENIDGLTKVTTGNTAIRSSNSASAYAEKEPTLITKLPAGKYKITANLYDASGRNASAVFYFTDGTDTLFTAKAAAINNSETTSDELTFASETNLTLAAGGATNKAVDYIYVVKTGDATASVAISDAKYATFIAPAALDFSNSDVKAFAVTVSNGTISYNEINAAPANTALLVYASAAGTYDIPVVASADAVTTDLKAAANDVTATGTQYVLANGDEGLGWYKVTDKVPAGKGYLEISDASAPAKAFYPIGSTTGINSIKGEENVAAKNAAKYNLAGQRVGDSFKGIVIQNGKKYIQK